jgi:hypothetical protein
MREAGVRAFGSLRVVHAARIASGRGCAPGVAFGSAFQSPTRRWGLWNFLLGDESGNGRANERMSYRTMGKRSAEKACAKSIRRGFVGSTTIRRGLRGGGRMETGAEEMRSGGAG